MGDSNALRDSIVITSNAGTTDQGHDGERYRNLAPIPPRPASSAKAAKWSAYCVALGAGRDSLEGMKKDVLVTLANSLGG